MIEELLHSEMDIYDQLVRLSLRYRFFLYVPTYLQMFQQAAARINFVFPQLSGPEKLINCY